MHPNLIESVCAPFKRCHHGTYHHMTDKHLDRYVRESVGRYNGRPAEQMAGMARGKRNPLRYAYLIARKGVPALHEGERL